MPQPDFIIAGAQKCGTTFLNTCLRLHSSIYIPRKPQELHFFDLDENYRRGMDWYISHFENAEQNARIGQTSPLYIYEPKAAHRISKALPSVGLIFILRNPVDRAYSHYWHNIQKGRETLSFEAALRREPSRIAKDFENRRHFSYIDRGRYAQQLERYLRLFPFEQLLVLLSEDMKRNPVAAINDCCDFLNVEPEGELIMDRLPARRINAARLPRSRRLQQLTYPLRKHFGLLVRAIDQINLMAANYPPMRPETRESLQSIFRDENRRLASLFDIDLSCWKPKRAESKTP